MDDFGALLGKAFQEAEVRVKQKEAARIIKALFDDFVDAGFTEEQATMLIGKMIGTGIQKPQEQD